MMEMEAFVDWCSQKGISTNPKLKMHYFDEFGGYGMQASTCISDGEILVSVPEKALITISSVTPILKNILKNCPSQLTSYEGLILFVLYCQMDESSELDTDYGPYLNVLPIQYTTPVSFPQLPMEILPPGIPELIEEMNAEIQQNHLHINRVFVQVFGKQLDYEQFLWAWNTVNSRCIFLETAKPSPLFLLDDTVSYAIAPMLDMFNHSCDPKATAHFNRKTASFDIISTSTIYAGDQIFICYGAHSNSKLYLEYGFTLEDNDNNSIELDADEVEALCSDVPILLQPEALQILREQKWKIFLYQVQCEPCWNSLSFCYILSLPKQELPKWKRIYEILEIRDPTTLQMLLTIMNTYLEQIQTRFAKIEPGLQEGSNILRLWNDKIGILEQSIQQTKDLLCDDSQQEME